MPTVDFVTFCCPKDVHKLHAPGWLDRAVQSHAHDFRKVYVLHQHLPSVQAEPLPSYATIVDVDDEIVGRHVKLPDEAAEQYTGPANRAHYWRNHIMNHLTGMEVSEADYILFQDADITYLSEHGPWIPEAISVLEAKPECLMVTPHWGGADGIVSEDVRAWYVNTVSQQIFLIRRDRMKAVDLNVPWNWEKLAPFGPMQEFYYMLEGRLWRYMDRERLVRGVLKHHRYWHHQW